MFIAYVCCISLKHIYIAYLCCRVAVFCSVGLGSIFDRLSMSLFDFVLFWGGLRGVLVDLLDVLGTLGPLLGELGSVLAGSGRSWNTLGRSEGCFGRSFGCLGGSWAAPG